jgi:hypothetical protein
MDKNIFENGVKTTQNLKFEDEIIKFESQLVRNWRINKFENLIKIWIILINEFKSLIEELMSLMT